MKSLFTKIIMLILVVSTFAVCQNSKNEQEELLGVWGTSIKENASFRVLPDSIYYPEYFKSFKYTTNKDSLIIQYNDWTFRGIFYFRNDSLIIKDNGKESAFIRFVQKNYDANEKPADNSKFKLEYNLTSKEGDVIGSIFVKALTENSEVFSSLIITCNGSSEDTLYFIKGNALSNKEGIDIKVREGNLYGYRFLVKNNDSFILTALHDNGKSVSDDIRVRWNYEKKVFEVEKAP